MRISLQYYLIVVYFWLSVLLLYLPPFFVSFIVFPFISYNPYGSHYYKIHLSTGFPRLTFLYLSTFWIFFLCSSFLPLIFLPLSPHLLSRDMLWFVHSLTPPTSSYHDNANIQGVYVISIKTPKTLYGLPALQGHYFNKTITLCRTAYYYVSFKPFLQKWQLPLIRK